MREADHVAAGFLGDVGEVLVYDLSKFISFPARLASCCEPLSILCVLPLLSFVEGSTRLVVVPFPRSVANFSACPFVERSGKVVQANSPFGNKPRHLFKRYVSWAGGHLTAALPPGAAWPALRVAPPRATASLPLASDP